MKGIEIIDSGLSKETLDRLEMGAHYGGGCSSNACGGAACIGYVCGGDACAGNLCGGVVCGGNA